MSIYESIKNNTNEKFLLELIGKDAIKSFISVLIIIAGILSYIKLCDLMGFWFTSLFVILHFLFASITCIFLLNTYEDETRIKTDNILVNYKQWKNIGEILNIKYLFYYNLKECGDNWEIIKIYCISYIISISMLFGLYMLGGLLIYIYAILYSLLSCITFPSDSIGIAIIFSILTISMLATILKTQWRKISRDKFDWNLLAWCVCISIVFTVMSFVAGVAIRRIAGYIGIEYTIGLVSLYIIITAIYVYNDLREWVENQLPKPQSDTQI